jgi:drug/metabolite transporter (DMT)-like permease
MSAEQRGLWLGFFAWYRGLTLGGTVPVSQVQRIQPLLTMLFAVPVLGERLEALTQAFGLAVAPTVVLGKRAPVEARTAQASPLPARSSA